MQPPRVAADRREPRGAKGDSCRPAGADSRGLRVDPDPGVHGEWPGVLGRAGAWPELGTGGRSPPRPASSSTSTCSATSFSSSSSLSLAPPARGSAARCAWPSPAQPCREKPWTHAGRATGSLQVTPPQATSTHEAARTRGLRHGHSGGGTERPLVPSTPTTAPGTRQLWVAPSGILLPLRRLCLGALEPLQESVRILHSPPLSPTLFVSGARVGSPCPARGEGLGYQNLTILCAPLALAQSLCRKSLGDLVEPCWGSPCPAACPGCHGLLGSHVSGVGGSGSRLSSVVSGSSPSGLQRLSLVPVAASLGLLGQGLLDILPPTRSGSPPCCHRTAGGVLGWHIAHLGSIPGTSIYSNPLPSALLGMIPEC